MEQNVKTSRIPELDLVRVIAMLLVVTYHFGCEYGGPQSPTLNFFCNTVNFDFGNVAVTLFLALSGALLYRKYRDCDVGSLGKFYAARIRAIYPPFWIMNLYILVSMARHFMSEGSPFFAGNPLKLLLTVVGFDGYVQMFGVETYYFCGEWFLGGIIFLYLLFPLLVWLYKKSAVALVVILSLGYGLQFLLDSNWDYVFSILPLTLLWKFVLGFVVMDVLPKIKNAAVGLFSLALFLVLCFVDIPGRLNLDFLGSVSAFLLFPAVLWMGGFLMKLSPLKKLICFLAPISYCVFLIQHIAIVWLQMLFARLGIAFDGLTCAGLLVVTLLATFIAAWCLKFAADKVTPFLPFSILVKKENL